MTHDAILRNWTPVVSVYTNTVVRFEGKIYEDKKGRFKDGDEILTSRAESIDYETGILTTQNSKYQLYPLPNKDWDIVSYGS
jgi:hypothetical protein